MADSVDSGSTNRLAGVFSTDKVLEGLKAEGLIPNVGVSEEDSLTEGEKAEAAEGGAAASDCVGKLSRKEGEQEDTEVDEEGVAGLESHGATGERESESYLGEERAEETNVLDSIDGLELANETLSKAPTDTKSSVSDDVNAFSQPTPEANRDLDQSHVRSSNLEPEARENTILLRNGSHEDGDQLKQAGDASRAEEQHVEECRNDELEGGIEVSHLKDESKYDAEDSQDTVVLEAGAVNSTAEDDDARPSVDKSESPEKEEATNAVEEIKNGEENAAVNELRDLKVTGRPGDGLEADPATNSLEAVEQDVAGERAAEANSHPEVMHDSNPERPAEEVGSSTEAEIILEDRDDDKESLPASKAQQEADNVDEFSVQQSAEEESQADEVTVEKPSEEPVGELASDVREEVEGSHPAEVADKLVDGTASVEKNHVDDNVQKDGVVTEGAPTFEAGAEVLFVEVSDGNENREESKIENVESEYAENVMPEPGEVVEAVKTTPWTPSYSVSRQGSLADFNPEHNAEAFEKDKDYPQVQTQENAPPLEVQIPAVNVLSEDSNSNMVVEEREVERPKSSWTPSYSVSKQGSPALSFKEVDALEATGEATATTFDLVLDHEEGSTERAKTAEAEQDSQILPEDEPTIETILAENDKVTDGAVEPEIASALEEQENLQNRQVLEAVPENIMGNFVPPNVEVTPDYDAVESSVAEPEQKQSWTQSYSVHVSNQASPILNLKELPAETQVKSESPKSLAIEIASKDAEEHNAEPSQLKRSSSWTQSYSVSNMGSPNPGVKDLPDEEQNALEHPQFPTVEPTPEENTEAVEEQPKPEHQQSWTRSYSVSNHGSPNPGARELPSESPKPPSVKITSEEGADEASRPAEPKRQQSWSQSYSVSNQGSPNIRTNDLPAERNETQRPQTPVIRIHPEDDSEAQRPEPDQITSWSQSYSVSNQGSPILILKDLSEEQDKPEGAVVCDEPKSDSEPQVHETGVTPEGAPQRQWTRSFSVVSQGSPHLSVKDLPSESDQRNEATVPPQTPTVEVTPEVKEEAPRSWTPSYSVSNQGSPHPSVKDLPVETSEVPAEVSQPEQPAQSWTPSYSVSRQGSPRPSVKNLETSANDKNNEPEPTTDGSDSKPLWRPSYSVSRQGSPAPSIKNLDISEPMNNSESQAAIANGGAHESDTKPRMQRSSTYGIEDEDLATVQQISRIDVKSENPEVALENLPVNKDGSAEVNRAEEVVERSKSPWTPSYSVSNQGIADEEALKFGGVAPEEEYDPALFGIQNTEAQGNGLMTNKTVPGQVQTVESLPHRPWTPSYTVTRQGTVGSEAGGRDEAKKLDSEELIMPQIDIEEPRGKSSDTRSNGTSTPTQNDVNAATPGKLDQAPLNGFVHAFPTLETLHDDLMKAAADVGDEADDTDAKPSLPPLKTNRERLDSAASSKFFPGGWISSPPPKTPQEGRASLEVVTGEFIPAKLTGDTHGLSPHVPSAPPVTPVTGVNEDDGKQWCVVM